MKLDRPTHNDLAFMIQCLADGASFTGEGTEAEKLRDLFSFFD